MFVSELLKRPCVSPATVWSTPKSSFRAPRRSSRAARAATICACWFFEQLLEPSTLTFLAIAFGACLVQQVLLIIAATGELGFALTGFLRIAGLALLDPVQEFRHAV